MSVLWRPQQVAVFIFSPFVLDRANGNLHCLSVSAAAGVCWDRRECLLANTQAVVVRLLANAERARKAQCRCPFWVRNGVLCSACVAILS